jgi:hypothetical protein
MTDDELEQRLRAWYSAEIDDAAHAPLELRTRVAAVTRTSLAPVSFFANRRLVSLLVASGLASALLVGGALAFGSGVVRLSSVLPPSESPSPSAAASPAPSSMPTSVPEPSGTASAPPAPVDLPIASPSAALGAGLILAYQPTKADVSFSHDPWNVFAIDPRTGSETLLGFVAPGRRHARDWPTFQWGPDRTHVLITTDWGQHAVALASPTAAGRELDAICCEIPTDVWQGGSSGTDGWVLSPRGDRVAAVRTSEYQVPGEEGTTVIYDAVVVANVNGTGVRTLPLPRGADGHGGPLSWSPDGSSVAVAGCRPCNWSEPGKATTVNHQRLFLVPIDGSEVRELLDVSHAAFGSPAWSPDGSAVAVAWGSCAADAQPPHCTVGGTSSIVSISLSDQRLTTIATLGSDLSVSGPQWSPDGKRLSFDGEAGTFVANRDGTELRNVGDAPLRLASWSPDGNWLLLEDETRLCIVDAHGGEPQLLGAYQGGEW